MQHDVALGLLGMEPTLLVLARWSQFGSSSQLTPAVIAGVRSGRK
ncbi:MAG: hypothetical protein ACI8QS_000216 [Planctomycetota bacterium]|jgi:hypothetical protein